ncbi:hypothetical protein ALC53_05648 [Atta colombica]|uniref:Uncharacterized protein n=1 Tax=Atta colombica TaxID=520822 RepID=A0A151I483_9HYME|nr:hypothetical protein ALC53_05648 [Atta colombica]
MLLDQQDFRLTETRSGDAPVMCRMRETDNGSVPAERFGPCMARRVRALFRLQSRVAGQVLLQGGEALLQKRLLQVRAYNSKKKIDIAATGLHYSRRHAAIDLSHPTVLAVPRGWRTMISPYRLVKAKNGEFAAPRCGEFNFAAAVFCGQAAQIVCKQNHRVPGHGSAERKSPRPRSGTSITPLGDPPPGVASSYTCGYGNRSPRVAARSLKVDNGPVAWPTTGHFKHDQKGRCPRFDATPRRAARRTGPSTAAKIITLKYGPPFPKC